jgi:hypothetical protein
MNVHARHILTPEKLIGTLRRFGVEGPVYEVFSIGPASADGDVFLPVRSPESGETLDYLFSHASNDPKEA